MKSKSYVGLALSLTLLAGAFSNSLAQSQNSAAESSATTTTVKTGSSTGKDLAISAAKSASHTILFRALRVSGLTEQASGKGPYTVFAPTNEAFEKLPAGTVDEFWKPASKAKLVKLLAYHVVKGKYTTDQLQEGQKLKTVTGGTLTVGKQGENITITDGAGNTATINQADVEATNGIVHSVDTVLMPSASK
ncbi:fasciclin domain-containing protein [Spirosoma aerophilum]